MIYFAKGDLFDSTCEMLVNPVNTVGVMGKGLAFEFKDRFAGLNTAYQQACRSGACAIGTPFYYESPTKKILCFPTKKDWRKPSRYEYVEAGLEAIVAHHQEWDITSMAMPALGCGLGGLDWKKVKLMMKKYLDALPLTIDVYEP